MGFENNTLDNDRWDATSILKTKDIFDFAKMNRLCGRVIKELRFVGRRRQQLYYDLEYYDGINHVPGQTFYRTAQIDQPLLIKFEDGDILAIFSVKNEIVKMSINTIPWDICSCNEEPNYDANVLFSPCIGKTIKNIGAEVYNPNIDVDEDPFNEDSR